MPNFSELGNLKLESLLQQGLDTFLKRQSNTPEKANKIEKILLKKRSLDRKGELYELPPTHAITLVAYQIRRKGSEGSILVTLEHLRKLYQELNQEILRYASNGRLAKAEKLWQQQKNVDILHYTHRIKAFRVNEKVKILNWIIDLDLHKETSDEQSYGSGTAKAVLESLMTVFLDEPEAKGSSQDYLDTLIAEDWMTHITEASRPFYNHSQLRHKIVFRKPPQFAF